MPSEEEVRSALNRNKKDLLKKKNVVGMGLGLKIRQGEETEDLALVVFVAEKIPLAQLADEDVVPRIVDDVETDVVETGEFRAFQTPPEDRQKMIRPAPPGVSIGHYLITAGTFGCIVKDQAGARSILSNNHVLANSNVAASGDAIVQPGPVDGGRDTIALLDRFETIYFPGDENPGFWRRFICAITNFFRWLTGQAPVDCVVLPKDNLVDAALGKPLDETEIIDEILDLGSLAGARVAFRGMEVSKSGRTTGTTQGTVRYIDATVTVNYGGGREAIFVDQIMIQPGNFSAGGDSGSAIVTLVDGSPHLVGLLFAGSIFFTIANRAEHVLDILDVAV